jgi:hypothetical protein
VYGDSGVSSGVEVVFLAEYWSTYSVRILRNGGDGRGRDRVLGRLISESAGGKKQRRCRSYYWAQRREFPSGDGKFPGT